MKTAPAAPTAVIAEDEPLLRSELRETLAALWPELAIVAEAEDGLQAISALHTHRPQLLRYVDKVLIMAEGQVQAFGPRDKVLAELNGARPPQSAQPTRATPQRRTSEGTAVAARQTA